MHKKIISRILFGFVNLGFVFKLLALYTGRRNRPFIYFEGKTYTYKEVYDHACKYAKLFHTVKQKQARQGLLKKKEALAIGLYMDNSPEFAFAVYGASMTGTTIFCINTGFRGETLANVINQAKCALLLTGEDGIEEVQKVLTKVTVLDAGQIFMIEEKGAAAKKGFTGIAELLDDPKIVKARLSWHRFNHWTPLIVIYTSGTTGAPKGVPCSHLKLIGAAVVTNYRIHLTKSDIGYVCMPMFHSNAWFIGILPLMMAGGCFVLKKRFSARAFEQDMLEHGVTYMNYVGQPVHYIIAALEKKYGSPEAVEAALAYHRDNKFRLAHGNGAPPVDREKFIRYLNMEHVYELYGSTEAAITTANQPGDPIDSVGALASKKIVILDEKDAVCPPGTLDAKGNLTNYDEAVGEICKKVGQNNFIFDGYFHNAEANQKKFRGNYFHSGDLGHICIINNKRYLYFDGRTDDWIRKDGENFSAENVQQYSARLPGVELAVAYGAPCEVADEKVMIAIKLKKNTSFDPQMTFDWFLKQQQEGGMDPKWMPDYIRIVDSFEMTHQTQKIIVRPLKRTHFNIDTYPDMQIYFCRRGDLAFKKMTMDEFGVTKRAFEKTGRLNLLHNEYPD